MLVGVAAGWLFASLGGSDKAETSPSVHRKERRLKQQTDELQRQLEEERDGATGLAPPTGSGRSGADGRTGTALAGLTVAVDPGHNGGNASHPGQIARQVRATADGATKACNTTGTETNDGQLTEAEFTLAVGQDLERDLRAEGATVIATRNSNDGVGPCVDRRAAIGNQAQVAISIHADGNESPGAHGFHVIYASRDEMVAPGLEGRCKLLAERIRDALVVAGVPISNYLGENGLDARDDLAGLNLSRVPAALVELGNMRSSEEAGKLENPAYRSRLAGALVSGLTQFLRQAQV